MGSFSWEMISHAVIAGQVVCMCDLLLCFPSQALLVSSGWVSNRSGGWPGLRAAGTGHSNCLICWRPPCFRLCIEQRSGGWQSQNENSDFISTFAAQSWSKAWSFTHYCSHHLRNHVLSREDTGRLGDAWKMLIVEHKTNCPKHGVSVSVLLFHEC